jgi:hypothetical protein
MTEVHLSERQLSGGFRAGSARLLQSGGTIDRHWAGQRITPSAFGREPKRNRRTTTMFSKIAIALLATTMLAAPVLAQGAKPAASTAPAVATQPVAKTPAVNPTTTPTVKADDPAVKKVIKVKRHKVKRDKAAMHVTTKSEALPRHN